MFLLIFNIYSFSNTSFGFETANRMGDLEGAWLDDAARYGVYLPIHAGHPIHQQITEQALRFLKDDVLKKINYGQEIADFGKISNAKSTYK